MKLIRSKRRIAAVLILAAAIVALTAGCGSGQKSSEGTKAECKEKLKTDNSVPSVAEVDYSKYFQGMDGCAVVLDTAENQYSIYQEQQAEERVSPCSTFKIISAVLGLENGILQSADTRLGYDGTYYARENWNGDLTLKEAFQESCVWYFRKVIDQVGTEKTAAFLKELSYGNQDISQWEGGTINPRPEMNGFWIESSLLISPKEQVEVLQKLFGPDTALSEEQRQIMKDVMTVSEQAQRTVYGKTGSGRHNSWFVGFCETGEDTLYFAVHLSDQSMKTVGAQAKDIALQIVKEEFPCT